MFKGSNKRVRINQGALPSNGQQVLVRAKISLYEPRGDFQLIIEHMEDAGAGLLRQQFEQLKNKLHKQGLFDLAYKKPLPSIINHVGVVTSPSGAAIKDILAVLKRRNQNIMVTIYPALVQGELAQADICHAIYQANLRNECDVLIVGRGGGSLEDLWPFNEESVAEASFLSLFNEYCWVAKRRACVTRVFKIELGQLNGAVNSSCLDTEEAINLPSAFVS